MKYKVTGVVRYYDDQIIEANSASEAEDNFDWNRLPHMRVIDIDAEIVEVEELEED